MLEWNKRWASVLECADLSHDQQRSLTPPLREHAQQTERKTLADEWEDQWMKTYRKGTPMLPFHNWIESFVGSTSTAGWTLKSHSYIFASHHLGGLFWFHIHQGYGNEKRTIWVLLLILFVQIKRVNIHYLLLFILYTIVRQRSDDRMWFSLLCKDKSETEVMQRQTFALMMLVNVCPDDLILQPDPWELLIFTNDRCETCSQTNIVLLNPNSSALGCHTKREIKDWHWNNPCWRFVFFSWVWLHPSIQIEETQLHSASGRAI